MHNSNWDDYRFLIAVIEAGSLNGAAHLLNVNHATVLRRITNFEAVNGIKLFEKHRAGYRLTQSRSDLMLRLQMVRESIEAAERVVMGEAQSLRGAVKITSTDSLCEAVLPDVINSLQTTFPDLQVELLSTNTRLNLAQMDAEILVRPARQIDDDLVGENVGTLGFRVYGSRDYVNKIKGLPDEDVRWLSTNDTLAKSPPGEWLRAHTNPDQWVFKADSFVTMRNLTLTGMGLAYLPCCLVTPETGLVTPAAFPERLETRLWVANHRDLESMARIQVTKFHVLAELRNQTARLG